MWQMQVLTIWLLVAAATAGLVNPNVTNIELGSEVKENDTTMEDEYIETNDTEILEDEYIETNDTEILEDEYIETNDTEIMDDEYIETNDTEIMDDEYITNNDSDDMEDLEGEEKHGCRDYNRRRCWRNRYRCYNYRFRYRCRQTCGLCRCRNVYPPRFCWRHRRRCHRYRVRRRCRRTCGCRRDASGFETEGLDESEDDHADFEEHYEDVGQRVTLNDSKVETKTNDNLIDTGELLTIDGRSIISAIKDLLTYEEEVMQAMTQDPETHSCNNTTSDMNADGRPCIRSPDLGGQMPPVSGCSRYTKHGGNLFWCPPCCVHPTLRGKQDEYNCFC